MQSHEDYQGIQLAHEAMVDVADYTNESTRDHEMCQIITDVQVLDRNPPYTISANLLLIHNRRVYLIGILWSILIW